MPREWNYRAWTVATSDNPDGSHYRIYWFPNFARFNFGQNLSVDQNGTRVTSIIVTQGRFTLVRCVGDIDVEELGIYYTLEEAQEALDTIDPR